MMNGKGKSDGFIVPEKSSNKAQVTAAEVMEGRKSAKGNSIKRNASRTQGRTDVHSALDRVRRAFWRYYLRQEPDEVVPQVLICAGGAS